MLFGVVNDTLQAKLHMLAHAFSRSAGAAETILHNNSGRFHSLPEAHIPHGMQLLVPHHAWMHLHCYGT
jgi:hypothetical protein